jgi:prophage regulatory protein
MKLLSMDELRSVKGISFSRPHLFRLIKAGQFPTPLKIGENRNAWTEEEIDAWVEKRVTERDALRKAS